MTFVSHTFRLAELAHSKRTDKALQLYKIKDVAITYATIERKDLEDVTAHLIACHLLH